MSNKMTAKPVRIAAIMPVFNRIEVTLISLHRLLSLNRRDISIIPIVVDDASTDGTESKVRCTFPGIKILKGDGNLWWAGGVNRGFSYISDKLICDYILILNNDTIFFQDTLDKLMEYVEPNAKAVYSPVTIDKRSGLIYNAGQRVTGIRRELKPIYHGQHPDSLSNEIIECDSIGTRFVLMPKRIIQDIGFFEQNKFPHGFSDFEYFSRANRFGYKIFVITNTNVYMTVNRSYIGFFIIHSTFSEYLKSHFDIRYGHNLKNIFYKSFVHKNILIGFLSFVTCILTHLKWLVFKLILPQKALRSMVQEKWISHG